MCGIAGVICRGGRPDSPARPPSGSTARPAIRSQATHRGADLQSSARAMAATLTHRGPDASSTWVAGDGACALAHTRLKVIDLETGHQPMGNEDGTVQVVFNGEIYNFRELRRELEAAGHRFRTRSDTEVLVHGWEAWGEDLPRRLDGMFAFGLWDSRQSVLFLGRDRAGKKPLFLYEDDRRFAFASETKALLALPEVDDALDPRAIPLYLAYGYVPTPGTFYRRIRKLPPGSFLRLQVEADGPNLAKTQGPTRYWSLNFTPVSMTEAEASGKLRALLTQAVERRLMAEVPLGAFLSGGIDSTLVVGLMSRFVPEPVRTFSIGMADDPNYDETRFARIAAERFGTRHTAFTLEAQEVGLLEDLLDAYDEPFGDSSALPTYIVSRLTRAQVTVALTGDGGDELFAGYPRFLGMRLAEAMPRWLVAGGNVLSEFLPFDPDFRSLSRRTKRFLAAAALPPEERMLRWIGFFPDRLGEILKPELAHDLSGEDVSASFREPLQRNSGLSPLAGALALNFETYLLDDLLVKADRCSMAHGLELRSPFLDTALMEFAASVPDSLKIRGRTMKYLLKQAFPDLLPASIRGRGKMGFGIPLPTWFRTHWRPLVEDRILDAGSPLFEWVRPEPVKTLVMEHMSETADNGHQIWALLTLDGWLRRGRFSMVT